MKEKLVIASVLNSFREVCYTEVQKNGDRACRRKWDPERCFFFFFFFFFFLKMRHIMCWLLTEVMHLRRDKLVMQESKGGGTQVMGWE